MKDSQDEIIEDNHIEDIEIEDIEKQSSKKIKDLKKRIKDLEKEKSDCFENLQRAKAEFLNAKKRLEEQNSTNIERSINDLIRNLLPLCDSFQLALENAKEQDTSDKMWMNGIEGIHSQLLSILKSYNVEIINPLNEKFNPKLHEAISVKDKSGTESDTVIEVLQLGFKRNNELIRPSKVILSK